MSERWFRFYDDAINDPKVLRLTDAEYRVWVGLLCVASKERGSLPDLETISIHLRMAPQKIAVVIAKLVKVGLLDQEGDSFSPHNWDKRQWTSDLSTARVAKYRAKRVSSGLPSTLNSGKVRPALIERDGPMCVYCGVKEGYAVDHMEPVCLGGTDDEDNLALACKSCNSGKQGRTPELARMNFASKSAESALRRYRDRMKCNGDTSRDVTVTETPPEYRVQNQSTEAERRARLPDLVDPREAEFRRGIVAAFESAKSPNVPDTSQAVIWLKAGYDPGICLAVIAELIRRKPDVSNLKYFERAIDEAHRKKAPPRVTLASEKAAAEATIAKKFHVKVDSPQWHAWARHLGKTPPKDSKFGWFFDSEWPPGHDPGSGADRQAELAS